MPFLRKSLEEQGFQGWIRLSGLQDAYVPDTGGVYVVIYDEPGPAAYLGESPAGWFKGKNPSVAVQDLSANWVEGAELVYIGKADRLRRRLKQFSDFGAGKPVGHWGGRLIWQLSTPSALKVAWKVTPGQVPLMVEAELIRHFRSVYGKPPFANAPHLLGR